MGILFITGIDTEIGKTYVTGLLARQLLNDNKSVITVKPVQTGCCKVSDDIITHRKIMNIELLPEDISGLTSCYVFEYTASPHLSSKLENRTIDIDLIDRNIEYLSQRYEYLLIEGSGGLSTPINEEKNFCDYICERDYETIVVTGGKLGSINHTVNTVDLMLYKKIRIGKIIFNDYGNTDPLISESAFEYLKKRYGNIVSKIKY